MGCSPHVSFMPPQHRCEPNQAERRGREITIDSQRPLPVFIMFPISRMFAMIHAGWMLTLVAITPLVSNIAMIRAVPENAAG